MKKRWIMGSVKMFGVCVFMCAFVKDREAESGERRCAGLDVL